MWIKWQVSMAIRICLEKYCTHAFIPLSDSKHTIHESKLDMFSTINEYREPVFITDIKDCSSVAQYTKIHFQPSISIEWRIIMEKWINENFHQTDFNVILIQTKKALFWMDISKNVPFNPDIQVEPTSTFFICGVKMCFSVWLFS